METPRTLTYPPRFSVAPGVVVSFGIYGTSEELSLPMEASEFYLGRGPECEVCTDNPYMSARHARLTRIDDGLLMTDVSSGKNDIATSGYKTRQCILRAGDTFTIGNVKYCALSFRMSIGRESTAWAFGLQSRQIADDLLLAAANAPTSPILLIGEQGHNQDALGKLVHEVSARREHPYQAIHASEKPHGDNVSKIMSARNGTLLIWIPAKTKLDGASVSALMSVRHDVRFVICAQTGGKVAASLPLSLYTQARRFDLVALRSRSKEIPELFDLHISDAHSPLEFAMLTDENQKALLSYGWPGNLEELRDSARNIVLLAGHRSEREAVRGSTQVTRASCVRGEDDLGSLCPFLRFG
jgi:hypothetical protein